VPKAEKVVNPSKVFKANSEVELRELKAEHLNGSKATVVSYDREAGRYAVLLAESGKSIKIKPENLFSCTAQELSALEEVVESRTTSKENVPASTGNKVSSVAESAVSPVADLKITSTVSLDSKNNVVIVKVKLPMFESSAGIKLQVSKSDLVLTYGEGDDEVVRAEFPTLTQPNAAVSKFFKKSKTMKISIPVHGKQ
jgi:hypothetical protein